MKKYGVIFGILFSVSAFAQEIQEIENVEALMFPSEESVILDTESEKTIHYTWADFLQEKSCQDDFNRLQEVDFLTESQQLLKNKMQTYCAGKITAWDTLLTLFRQNKKTFLIDKTLKGNGLVVGHIKALPYYLFDIHNTTPIGIDLAAKLDRIQNAVQSKNPEQVILLMQDLSPNEQLFFIPLFNEANTLIDFKNALGGDND